MKCYLFTISETKFPLLNLVSGSSCVGKAAKIVVLHDIATKLHIHSFLYPQWEICHALAVATFFCPIRIRWSSPISPCLSSQNLLQTEWIYIFLQEMQMFAMGNVIQNFVFLHPISLRSNCMRYKLPVDNQHDHIEVILFARLAYQNKDILLPLTNALEASKTMNLNIWKCDFLEL